ncbi:SGNH/GDSL hydrolase family protein [Paenarthrobacter aurescens]|uniref:SGNH/GDSL hydrolase family protein n=1 Tax=Paenarthrobacter aurescens TaxID=43663 RepID=UPI001141AD8D|nr:SGNH/GDSL hydrolase family protein [Paenarthrobacter aurescens]MDO6144635.1 SGNH/GDSL hydrolase family protein [Paenarthrobacter aurescens]MDO6148480.1 SGNH/GDSL hydrolase family protein [Paenarthrobacter aurescens]MDO6159726.1 SGNH/GDSL hydrolase family protein [Paenarthrobacter aurescens]MDO6164628.1 SGNH/GDSL hydrolase family protein [Paenarthrobacter aurescens]
MATHQARRRNLALAGGLAALALTLGFTAGPATAAPPPPVDYVALGDSYTAGTGADGLYRPPVACWQSPGGYVDLADASPKVTLTVNLACHGAVLSDASPFYDVVTPTIAQQIAAGQQALAGAELISITAGAVDAGSGLALQACASPDTQLCAATVAGIIANLQSGALQTALATTYQAIEASAPDAVIAVLGYPRLFDPSQGDIVINGITIVPVQNQILVNQAIDALNATIAAAVASSGTNAVFIDVTKRFLGHAVNSDNPWIVLDLTQAAADANFHPSDAGHQAYASALLSSVKLNQLAKR